MYTHCPSLSQQLGGLLLKTNLLFLSSALKVFGALALSQVRLQGVGGGCSSKKKGWVLHMSEVGGESWLLRPVLETKPQNFPEVRLEIPPCWGSVCHVCVPRMCAWFHSHGNNSKAMILARSTEGHGLPSYLKQNIYVESRVNGSGATRKATKSPLLTMVHWGDKLLEGKIKRNS